MPPNISGTILLAALLGTAAAPAPAQLAQAQRAQAQPAHSAVPAPAAWPARTPRENTRNGQPCVLSALQQNAIAQQEWRGDSRLAALAGLYCADGRPAWIVLR